MPPVRAFCVNIGGRAPAVISATFDWLLDGDPAIRWQVARDLLGRSERAVARERRRVAQEGWGPWLLVLQDPSGQWGGGLYTPKWTSTAYTMLLLRDLGLPPGHAQALKACRLLLDRGLCRDGGIDYSRPRRESEACITGMVLSLVARFRLRDERVERLVEHLLRRQMKDGGWNCQDLRGATHSSFHTTILVLEGLRDYEKSDGLQVSRVRQAERQGREFFLRHRLFRSHRTGEVVHPAMTRFAFPPRWHYDVLRGLDYFRDCDARDERLEDAIDLLRRRRQPDGCWLLRNRYPGRTHFEMEEPGRPSRWNTLRALRVLRWWEDWPFFFRPLHSGAQNRDNLVVF